MDQKTYTTHIIFSGATTTYSAHIITQNVVTSPSYGFIAAIIISYFFHSRLRFCTNF